MTQPQRRYIDLSHTIEDGTVTYKGFPAPIICDFRSREDSAKYYEPGTEFQIGRIDMIANTGTYLDTPFHRYADGHDLSGIELDQVIDLEGVVVRVPHLERLAVTSDDFAGLDVAGTAVLVDTGWSEFWNTEAYFDDHPFLTENAASYLIDAGAKLVGIDSHNIDDSRGNRRPVHTILLGAGVLIVEHMRGLENVPDGPFFFTAVPPKFKGVGTFPVRAFAWCY
jgi:kynurenine formamidase